MLFLLSALLSLSVVLSLAFRPSLFSAVNETVYKQKRLRADMFDRCALILFHPTSLAIISSNCFFRSIFFSYSLMYIGFLWRIKNRSMSEMHLHHHKLLHSNCTLNGDVPFRRGGCVRNCGNVECDRFCPFPGTKMCEDKLLIFMARE